MKGLSSRFLLILFSGLLIFSYGCDSAPGAGDSASGDSSVVDNQSADFNLTLSSYAKNTNNNAVATTEAPLANNTTINTATLRLLTGNILVIHRSTGEEQLFNWALYIDETAIEIQAEIKMDLPEGVYDFYFLMSADQNQYAAITTSWLILDGQNAVPFLIHPVIGDTIPDIHVLASLAEFQFLYDNDVISNFANPAFGISVDGGEEHIFSINPNTGLSKTFIYLEAGTYQFGLRFYDGSLLKSVLVDSQSIITITDGGGSIQLDVIPLISENTYTYDTLITSGVFHLVVPNDVIDEAGNIANVTAIFSLTGEGNQPIELIVPLNAVGDNYEGIATIPNFTPGSVNWSLQIADISNNINDVYAYCGQSIVLTFEPQTLSCDFTMVVRSFTVTDPINTLIVSVNESGVPVAGAVVTANDNFIGITGNGETGSLLGQLQTFLTDGSYTIKATSSDGNQIVESTIMLAGGAPYYLELDLPPAVNNPPTAEDSSVDTNEDVVTLISLPGSDPDSNSNVFWTLNSEPSHGQVNIEGNTATYTPETGYFGTDSFTYIVSDGELESDPATVFINVVEVTGTPVNTVPTAGDLFKTVNQNTSIDIILIGDDEDGNNYELTYHIENGPDSGTISHVDGSKNVNYTPNTDATSDIFTYFVNDGADSSNPATVTITVNMGGETPVNTAPTATGLSETVNQGASINITLDGNDGDGDELTYHIVSGSNSGTISHVDDSNIVTYSASSDATSDSFTYFVNDGVASSSTVTVTITVNVDDENPVNVAPIASDLSETVSQGSSIEITLIGNDVDGDNNELTYHIESGPNSGTLIQVDDSNLVTYTADTDATSDSFTYFVNDGVASSSPKTVTVAVNLGETPVPNEEFVLSVSFNSMTRHRTKDEIVLDAATSFVIPLHQELEVVSGNPVRFVLLLKFDKTSCVYLGGKYSASFGGELLYWFEKHRRYWSPVCGHGKYKAGDIIKAKRKITARLLYADRFEELTTIRIKIATAE